MIRYRGTTRQTHRALAPEPKRVVNLHLRDLERDPRGPGCLQLQGVHPPMHRVVAGRWRILYEIDDARGSVFILCISRRETAYDDLPSARPGGDS